MRARPLIFALGLVVLTSCTSARPLEGMPPEPAQPLPLVPANCPGRVPTHLPHSVPGMPQQMVPGSPSAVVVCGPGSRVILRGLAMDQLVTALNGLRHAKSGMGLICSTTEPTVGFYFNYAQGRPLIVSFSPSGCLPTSNGRLTAYPTKKEFAIIDVLLKG